MKVSAGNKIVLIGAGDVGVAFSYALVNQGICDHLAIIDIDERKTEGNVMDLNHGVVWAPSRTKVTRRALYDQLRKHGILGQVHYIPVHLQPYYRSLGFKRGDFPAAEAYYARAISLPLFPEMTPGQQDRVVAVLREALRPATR